MAINYKQIPDYNQFVQSYFADQELLDTQDVGTVLVENASTQASDSSSTACGMTDGAGRTGSTCSTGGVVGSYVN